MDCRGQGCSGCGRAETRGEEEGEIAEKPVIRRSVLYRVIWERAELSE